MIPLIANEGIVVGNTERIDHVRDSADSRAANIVSFSAFRLLREATAVLSKKDHHSAGMLSRCHHLETVLPDTAGTAGRKSDAMASLEGQSSITSRNEAISVMPRSLGRFVLNCKANLSLDGRKILGHTVRMTELDEEAQYKQEFIARVREARSDLGWKQWQMAEALGMQQDKYKQYETRSYLPHHLIGRFCLVTRVEPEWLMTGRGEKTIQPLKVVERDELVVATKAKKAKARKVA